MTGSLTHPGVPLWTEGCGGCADCERSCPTRAILWREAKGRARILVDDALCDGCGACVRQCPRGVLCLGPVPGPEVPREGSLRLAAIVDLRPCHLCGETFPSSGAACCLPCSGKGAA